jgi:hypothetical protein
MQYSNVNPEYSILLSSIEECLESSLTGVYSDSHVTKLIEQILDDVQKVYNMGYEEGYGIRGEENE